jgi:SAM-dependent methyltransferase
MHEPPPRDQIEAALAYEALFVPALFRPWASIVADAARLQPGQRVLDVACGTGVLAREAADRVGPSGRVVGLDPNPGMIAVAADHAPHVEWRPGSAESLPFPDGSFDAVVSQFGLMFFADRSQAIREMMRVLVPGGLMTIAVWNSLESMPAYAAEVELLERTAGRPAADALRAPFVLGNLAELAVFFAEAGVRKGSIETHQGVAGFPGIRTMVEADLRGWLPMMGINLTDDHIDAILQEAEHALAAYRTADNRIAFPVSAHVATGENV